MLESEAYKTYHAYTTGEKIPKPKYVKNKSDLESSPKKKSAQASKGKRLKTSTKVAKPVNKKQPATTSKEKGLNVLSEVALSEAEQIKLATKRILIKTHNYHASGSGADEGTGVIPGVPDVPTYNSDDEQISWKSSDDCLLLMKKKDKMKKIKKKSGLMMKHMMRKLKESMLREKRYMKRRQMKRKKRMNYTGKGEVKGREHQSREKNTT
ncbi:hypothetical protein Tco_0764671 [Tanacetum coccineum]